jgi:phage recombination protein Bet
MRPSNAPLGGDRRMMELTEERLRFLKAHYAKDATPEEFQHFASVCRARGLNPELGHVYFMKPRRRDGSMGKASIVLSITAYRLIAQRSGAYGGSTAGKIDFGADGKPLSATVTVRKLIGGELYDFTGTAYYSEQFRPGSSVWLDMPITMLEKCAEAKALRKAFPEELSGLLVVDEVESEGSLRVTREEPQSLPPRSVSTSDPKVLLWLKERLSEAELSSSLWPDILRALDGVPREELKARLISEIERHSPKERKNP